MRKHLSTVSCARTRNFPVFFMALVTVGVIRCRMGNRAMGVGEGRREGGRGKDAGEAEERNVHE